MAGRANEISVVPGADKMSAVPGRLGTAVFRTAYGPYDQLSARVRADVFRARPDNAGQPAGLAPVYTNAGHRPDALRGAELPGSHAARGNEKKGGLSPNHAGETPALRRASPFTTLSRRERGFEAIALHLPSSFHTTRYFVDADRGDWRWILR